MSDSIDPALAHLYGDVVGAELEDGEPLPPVTETSLEKLTAERGREEELSDHDAEELAVLLESREVLTIDELVELGLMDPAVEGSYRTSAAGAKVFPLLNYEIGVEGSRGAIRVLGRSS